MNSGSATAGACYSDPLLTGAGYNGGPVPITSAGELASISAWGGFWLWIMARAS